MGLIARPIRVPGRAGVAAGALLLAVAVAGCGSSAATSSPSPSAAGTPAGSSPAGSDLDPAPSGTPWPGNVPDSVIALGALDEQIAAAGEALDAGITAKDLKKTQAAAKGLVNLVDESGENISMVQGYAGTKELGDAYADALAQMRIGAQEIVDGVEKGEAATVDQGVTDLSKGITMYGLARRTLGNFMEQALSMKKMYVK